jgi:uncharacterized protein YndB with AHSA1/START domain
MSPQPVEVKTPSDREISIIRTFNAPRNLVFDCWTRPELVRRWLGLLPGWSMTECTIDLRVGGSYRYAWEGPEGMKLGISGFFREIDTPAHLVNTERFDESWYPGDEALDTTAFVEDAGRTTVTTTILYASQEARDVAAKSGMTEGMSAGYDMLDALLKEL